MPRMIRYEDPDGEPVFIRSDAVEAIGPVKNNPGQCKIYLEGDRSFTVMGTPDGVATPMHHELSPGG